MRKEDNIMEWLADIAWYWWAAIIFVVVEVLLYFKDR